ncbi:substrate-binding domain-containing protein [Streptomyces sp. NPDC055709]
MSNYDTATIDLDFNPSAVIHAREATNRLLESWSLADIVDPVTEVICKLVSSALRHSPGPTRMRFYKFPLHVLIQVFDTSTSEPCMSVEHLPDGSAECDWERVESLADQWGWSQVSTEDWPSGKCVWLTYRIPGTVDGASLCSHNPSRAALLRRVDHGPTETIGVITPFSDSWYFSKALAGVESVVDKFSRELVIYSLCGNPRERDREFWAHVVATLRPDALLVMSLDLNPSEISALHHFEIPVVLMGARAPGFSSVAVDDFAAAEEAVGFLAYLGHNRIGYIGGRLDEPFHFTAPMDRRSGYRAALIGHGLDSSSELEVQEDFTVHGGARAMAKLLSIAHPPTAVFAASDEMAFGAMGVLRDSGIRIPADLSIIGFDDHEFSELVGLTTVSQEVYELGAASAHVLLKGLNEASLMRTELTAPTRLTIRETCGPPSEAPMPGSLVPLDSGIKPVRFSQGS